MHTCNCSAQKEEGRESEVPGHPWLYRELETNLGYGPCFCFFKGNKKNMIQ